MPDPTEFGEKAITAATNFIRRGKDAAQRETRVIKLQTQISRLRSQRAQLLTQMGEKVFDLFERDLVKNQDLRLMCQQIRGVDAEIEMRREEVAQIRKKEAQGEGGIDSDPVVEILDDEDEIIRD